MLVKTYMPLKGTVMMVWTSLILMNTFQCSAQSMHHRLSAQNLKEASAVVQGGVSEEAMPMPTTSWLGNVMTDDTLLQNLKGFMLGCDTSVRDISKGFVVTWEILWESFGHFAKSRQVMN